MPVTPQHGPLERLSWFDRRRWSRRARRVVREFEAETLSDLQSLAGSGPVLEWMSSMGTRSHRRRVVGRPDDGDGRVSDAPLAIGAGLAGPVEFSAGGRRVVAAAVWAPAWENLLAAWRSTVVTLAGAGRYHRSWVLQFRVAASSGPQAGVVREFVLLASRVRLVDHWGGSRSGGDIFGSPVSPAAFV
jgi:hypothetical protein